VKVRIIKQPTGFILGLSLDRYYLHHVYDVAPTLATYLVAEGYATFEMRDRDRRSQPRPTERRKSR
jgi:hypothetical protein